MTPDVSAIIVTLGEEPRLDACLAGLAEQGLGGLEVIVVQNGVDGPGPRLGIEPDHRIRRTENPGFGAAVNRALDLARAPAILSLNPDVVLHPRSVVAALGALMGDPAIGAVAFRLERPEEGILDSAGIHLGPFRRARDRGMGRPSAGRYLEGAEVDAACMAAALFRRAALEAARDGAGEVLDERLLAYKEDVDLGWRIRRAGYRIVYEPAARATHQRGWREGARRGIPLELRRESLKNRWQVIAKNESAGSFVIRLPLFILFEMAVAAGLLVREPRVLAAYARATRELAGSLRRRPLAASPPGSRPRAAEAVSLAAPSDEPHHE
jgi:GT2 family glycosyltransferase